MSTAQPTTELFNLTFHDWQSARSATLEGVSRRATVGQVVAEATRSLQLPFASFYRALYEGRELNHGNTLGEEGIERDETLDLVAEVSAG
jgi:hypothetical protein